MTEDGGTPGSPGASTAYNLVIVGGTAGALSVAISSQRSGLGLVRVLVPGNEVAFPALVGEEQLDVGYGEPVSSITAAPDGEHLVITSAKQVYTTRAVMVAQRPPNTDWTPPMPVPAERVHVDEVPGDIEDNDVLVVGHTDHSVEVATALTGRGARVVLAAGGMDPARLSPSAENMLRRLEHERKATLLYRSTPDSIGQVGGFPMAFFGDRRTPDLQFDHVVFAPPRRALTPEQLGITEGALASGRVWFQGNDPAATGQQVAPGWRIGLDIARACFPELELAEPTPSAERLRRHTAAIDELRAEAYNATITQFEPTHSDLWVLRVRADHGDTSHIPGQYASLGLGYWEDRIDEAEDPGIDQRWDKLIRRSYSISNRIFDRHGYLAADDTRGNELEFYIVLVPPTPDNIPALTPRLALKRPGDRLYLGPKVAGRYTLTSVTDPTSTVLLLSTGTGEAPHNSMAVELLRKGHTGPIVAAVSVRQWADLGYLDKHRSLEQRYPNYHYLPLPTREADVPKRYIQDVLGDGTLRDQFGITLDPAATHVFLCGNPAMIGLPIEHGTPRAGDGALTFPETKGVVEMLVEQGFTLDSRANPGNIHYEEYW